MKDYTVKYSHCLVGPKTWGDSNAVTCAKVIKDVTVAVAGVAITPISIFGAGKSLYDQYINKNIVVEDSNNGNTITTSVIYDRLEKDTRVFRTSSQSFQSGKISHKVWLNLMHNDYYKKSEGRFYTDETVINRTFYSKYWEDNERTLDVIGQEAFLKLTIRDTTFYLNGK